MTTDPSADVDESRHLPAYRHPTSAAQGWVTICLLVLGLTLAVYLTLLRPSPRWEYRVVSFHGEDHERTGAAAALHASVTPDAKELAEIGKDGWEVVGSYLEMETAYPNFGRSEYVTGLQPNVRPQRLVLLLGRRIR
jgi:hypothetical protein